MKTILFVISLLVSLGLQAEQVRHYQHSGIITAAPEKNGTVIISNQAYQVDPDTRIHGGFPNDEYGPTPRVGSEVGFNLQLREDTHYITDIWSLDNDND